MPWRLHISDSTVQHLDVTRGRVVAAWPSLGQVCTFDLATGVPLGTASFVPPLHAPYTDAAWSAFLGTLIAPDGALLPVVRMPGVVVHSTDSGHVRLFDDGVGLTLMVRGEARPLGVEDAALIAVGLARRSGTVAAVDERGRLHLWRQAFRVGAFDIGLARLPGVLPELALLAGGEAVYLSDGAQVVLVNLRGQVVRRTRAHYPVGRIACSPNGRLLVTCDTATGVIRVYYGQDLRPAHQRFAIDLVVAADLLQLMADLPSPTLAPSSLVVTDDGTIVFALEGVLCATTVTALTPLPRPDAEDAPQPSAVPHNGDAR